MAEPPEILTAMDLSVRAQVTVPAASLRYFDPAAEFALAAGRFFGEPLPLRLRAVRHAAASGDGGRVLAWRRSTETLLLAEDDTVIPRLTAQLQRFSDGCLVDQTGGVSRVTVSGNRTAQFLMRLGSAAAVPGVGESLSSRIAELTVLSLCVRPGEVLMLVDRSYLPHLMGWIRATVADLDQADTRD
jgi:hypothetical protein